MGFAVAWWIADISGGDSQVAGGLRGLVGAELAAGGRPDQVGPAACWRDCSDGGAGSMQCAGSVRPRAVTRGWRQRVHRTVCTGRRATATGHRTVGDRCSLFKVVVHRFPTCGIKSF